MKNAGVLFSVGNWLVRPGQEKAFIEAWTEFAEWTMEHQKGAVYGQLLQDIVQPGHFVSFGPWETVQDIEAWRSTPEFRNTFARFRELCTEIHPYTMQTVAYATEIPED